MLPDPQILMAALAMTTERIRLGTSITILPLHHPIRIAEDLAMLDNLSGGRIDVGVGRGMPQLEYRVYGGNWDESQEFVEEGIDVLRGAWTQRPFEWRGRHYSYPEPFTVMPPVVQDPHPPIWMTANFDADHFRWIGLKGLNLMTLPWILPDYERSRELIGIYREALREGGHDEREVMAHFPVYVARTAAEARAHCEESWDRWCGISFGERGAELLQSMDYDRVLATHRGIFGDPAMCRDHIAHIQERLGLTHLSCTIHFGGLPQEYVLSSLRLFAEEVAPSFSA